MVVMHERVAGLDVHKAIDNDRRLRAPHGGLKSGPRMPDFRVDGIRAFGVAGLVEGISRAVLKFERQVLPFEQASRNYSPFYT